MMVALDDVGCVLCTMHSVYLVDNNGIYRTRVYGNVHKVLWSVYRTTLNTQFRAALQKMLFRCSINTNYAEPRNSFFFFFCFDALDQCVIALNSNNEQFHHKTEAYPKYRQNWNTKLARNWLYFWSPIFVSPNVF